MPLTSISERVCLCFVVIIPAISLCIYEVLCSLSFHLSNNYETKPTFGETLILRPEHDLGETEKWFKQS